MNPEQQSQYLRLANALKVELRQALRAGDQSLLGVVLNALLAERGMRLTQTGADYQLSLVQ